MTQFFVNQENNVLHGLKICKNIDFTYSLECTHISHLLVHPHTHTKHTYYNQIPSIKLKSRYVQVYVHTNVYMYYVCIHIHIGEGNGNPLQYACLENPTDVGAWQATVHGVAKSQTRLGDFTSLTSHFITEGNGNPLQYSCLENPMGQRSLAGHGPLGCRESDTAEVAKHAGTHIHMYRLYSVPQLIAYLPTFIQILYILATILQFSNNFPTLLLLKSNYFIIKVKYAHNIQCNKSYQFSSLFPSNISETS